jgi:hypothetical protein
MQNFDLDFSGVEFFMRNFDLDFSGVDFSTQIF